MTEGTGDDMTAMPSGMKDFEDPAPEAAATTPTPTP